MTAYKHHIPGVFIAQEIIKTPAAMEAKHRPSGTLAGDTTAMERAL
jgi:hypothetical protein